MLLPLSLTIGLCNIIFLVSCRRVGMKMVPRTCSELMLLLVQEPIRDGDREGENRTSWKPEVPFMAGSFEGPVRETSHTAHTHCYVEATGSTY